MDARDLDMLGMNLAEVGTDLISRAEAIDLANELYQGINIIQTTYNDVRKAIVAFINLVPSAQSSLITWLLDEIWDEEMWELNWQAFPELLCRKLEKLGYVKRTGDEYERLD